MAKTNQNDIFYANNVRSLQFTVMNEDVTPNVALNLTGYTVRWALSKFSAAGAYLTTPVIKKDSAMVGGVTITDAANGKVTVAIAAADTAPLAGKYYQELEIVDGSGAPVVVATGTLTINKNVSNT